MSFARNHHAQISRGRKAGLNTRELYSVIATQPLEGSARSSGQADGNGFVSSVTPRGRAVYSPVGGRRP
jgi:hypothetical protein